MTSVHVIQKEMKAKMISTLSHTNHRYNNNDFQTTITHQCIC